MQEDVFIGLGSNLDQPGEQLRRAMAAIAALPGVALRAASSFYRSAPLGYDAQPDFVNAVMRIATELTPTALLDALQRIEQAQGRRRTFRDAPRTLDLDILLYGAHCQDDPHLTLPHPRCHQRAFVLLPLLELAPDCVIPGQGPVALLAANCRAQRIARLADLPDRP